MVSLGAGTLGPPGWHFGKSKDWVLVSSLNLFSVLKIALLLPSEGHKSVWVITFLENRAKKKKNQFQDE